MNMTMKDKARATLYMAGLIMLAGTVGHADTHPYESIITMLETAAVGCGCIGAAMAMGRKPAKRVDAIVEVLSPVGGTYCRNPYYTR